MSLRSWTLLGPVALVGVTLVAVLAPMAAEALRWVPFLLGLVVFALPHGAVDHHVPRRLGARGGARFIALYAAAVAAGVGCWALAPRATLVAFLVVAGLHWGAGDAWFARATQGRPRFAGRLDAALFVLVRGALPVALPALAHPAELARGAGAILGAVGADDAPTLSPAERAVGLVVVGLLVAAALVRAVQLATSDGPVARRAGRADAAELVVLVVAFSLTPAVLAVGTYLLAWHAARHVVRLIAADPQQAALPPRRALLAWTREAAPLTLVSLAGLAALAATAWRVPVAADAVAGASLALIAALTFPHAAVVVWMDRRQAVFALAGRGQPNARRSASTTRSPAWPSP